MPGGRPSFYREDYAKIAKDLCLLGYTDANLANFFRVTTATIKTWKQAHPEFLAAIEEGKDPADAKVASALYKRACGYTEGKVHYPPDTKAASLWLRNRQPKRWRDKQEVELQSKDLNLKIVSGIESPPPGTEADE